MGYTTSFEGELKFNRPLAPEHKEFVNKLASTRRMARRVGPEYGVEGEFYVDDNSMFGEGDIIDHNRPPKTQPGLWCQWITDEKGEYLMWDGGEKFYGYVEWLEYLINKVFAPRGYVLNGSMRWFGEDRDDVGTITVIDNKVKVEED